MTLLSGTLGGATAGAAVGMAGNLVSRDGTITAGTVFALALVVAPMVSPQRLPEVNRETDQSLLSLGPFRWAAANGFLLGLGFTSRIGYWIFYLVPVGCLVARSPAFGAVIWTTYGFTRLGIVTLMAFRMHQALAKISALSRSLLALRPAVRRISNPATAVGALVLALWLGL